MEQTKLFNIEPIPSDQQKKRPVVLARNRISRNKRTLKQENSLMHELAVEIKKVPLLICKQPKTIKMIPYNWTQEQKEAYIASHFDQKGHFKFDPAPDFTILGGQQNRR